MTDLPELRPYQREGVAFLKARPRAFLADEMGLGKSVQALLASEGKTLVVAPAMLLDGGVWQDEILRWVPERQQDFTLAAYTSLNVRQGRKATPVAKPEYRQRWDTLILDEAQMVKGRGTHWTKSLDGLAKRAGRVIVLTGTPVPNWAHELFSTLRMLYPARARPGGELGSYWRWAGRWFDTEPEVIWVRGEEKTVEHVGELLGCTQLCEQRPLEDPCEHYQAFTRANLGDLFLRRQRDDVLPDLPPLTMEKVSTPMTARQGVAYREMRDEWLSTMGDGALKVAWSSSARHVMLDKLATGLEVLDPTAKASSGKLERLAYDLAQRTRPTLVVAHFRTSVEAAAEVARGLGARTGVVHGGIARPVRGRVVEEFKAGRLDVLCGSLETVAEGLTLTAADMVIFLETSFKPSRNQQALRRIHRLGQERPCIALDYITPGTIDEGKRELLARKTDHQIRILSAAELAAIS